MAVCGNCGVVSLLSFHITALQTSRRRSRGPAARYANAFPVRSQRSIAQRSPNSMGGKRL
jgi:hypothetical protein